MNRASEPFTLAVPVDQTDLGFGRRAGFAGRLPAAPGVGDGDGGDVMAAKGVQHRPVGRGVEKPVLLELTDDFHQPVADPAQQRHAHGLIVDEGAAAPIGADLPAQQERILRRDALLGQKSAQGVA